MVKISILDDDKTNKKNRIPASLRRDVWFKHFEPTKGKCVCCNTKEITPFDFECGHIVAEAEGGVTSIDNLIPICSLCNKSAGVENMNKFKEKFYPGKKTESVNEYIDKEKYAPISPYTLYEETLFN